MCHLSPSSLLTWAILFTLLGAFLLFHLWSFDHFKCLKWDSGPYSGAFKRVMTYSYLLSVPLIVIYSIGFAVVKYKEGFMSVPGVGIMPKPYQAWLPEHRSLIFPLYLIFSIGWSLEMVTHLEELCFWLFLINAGSAQQDWFRSLFFRTWTVGSVCAVIYMPLITIVTRQDPLRCEAYTVLGGSLGSLALTVWFTPILWTFPSFLQNLRNEGVDTGTVVRLTKFHELNTIRVIFRFLFVIPFLILGADGVRPHPVMNTHMIWTDLMTTLAGIGVVISSAITLVIFFPRSIEGEIAARDAVRESRILSMKRKSANLVETQLSIHSVGRGLDDNVDTERSGKVPPLVPTRPVWKASQATSPPSAHQPAKGKRREENYADDIASAESAVARPRRPAKLSKLNPLVHNYTSPIDLAYSPNLPRGPKDEAK